MSGVFKKIFLDRFLMFVSIFFFLFAVFFIVALFLNIFSDGLKAISWKFLTGVPSRRAEEAGIFPAIVGSIYVSLLSIFFAFPFGVLCGIYLEEYVKRSGENLIMKIIYFSIFNLSSIPSIIFGVLGNAFFVLILKMGRSVLSGSLTLSLMALPIIIVSTVESLRQIPFYVREASYSLGATKLQTTFKMVLPTALPGIMTGTILAFSRIMGETAPLIMIGALTFITFLPTHPLSPFTVLPIQAFNWISRPQEKFHILAAGTLLVLLILVFSINQIAIYLRNKYSVRFM